MSANASRLVRAGSHVTFSSQRVSSPCRPQATPTQLRAPPRRNQAQPPPTSSPALGSLVDPPFASALSSLTGISDAAHRQRDESNLLSEPLFVPRNFSRQAACYCLIPPPPKRRAFSSKRHKSTMSDPRESSSYSIIPRIRYNTIGGINGPLVILDNVWPFSSSFCCCQCQLRWW